MRRRDLLLAALAQKAPLDLRRIAAAPQILAGIGREDDAIRHVLASGASFDGVKSIVDGTAQALLGLPQTATDTLYGVLVFSDLLVGFRVHH